jgi:hypothetical protein
MKTREQIIKDALTGKLGSPFIPSEAAIQKERVKQERIARSAEIPLPVRSDKTSDANELISIGTDIEDRLNSVVDTTSVHENNILQHSILQHASFNKNKKQMLSIQNQATDLRITAPGSSSPKVISDHFRTPKIDMNASDIDISAQSASAGLKRVNRVRANTNWSDNDLGGFQVVTGGDKVNAVIVHEDSSLNHLVDGTAKNWSAQIHMNVAGSISAELTIPFLTNPFPVLNRIDIESNIIRPIGLILYPEAGQEIKIGKSSRTGDVVSWIFEPKIVRSIKFVFEWSLSSVESIDLSLDDLGLYLDVYHGTGKLISKSRATTDNDDINTVSLAVNEETPRNTGINYFVGLDPTVSGCFLNVDGVPVKPGYSAVQFSDEPNIRPPRIPRVHASELKRWSHLSGATLYAGWEPQWSPIQPLHKEATVNLPHHVTFDNTATIRYTDKLADGNNYGIEKGYDGETAGWWRPGVQNDKDGDARVAYPDFTVNGKDFYRIFYWPSGSKPIDGSLYVNGGSQTIESSINASGQLWSIADRSQPALVDVTTGSLTPDASGIINITGAADIQFDTVKDLRFTDSHDAPFIRGEDYRIYGSGTTLQVDVSEIESITDLFDNPDRTYEVTYTIDQKEGIVTSYSFHTTAQVAPTVNASVQFKRTSLLRSIKIIHMQFNGTVSNIEVIEDPGGYSQITRKLSPGFTRIQIVSSVQTYKPIDYINFNGEVTTVETPMGMREVSMGELLYNSPRFDHSTYALAPGPSGQTWLVVPDPGSESDRVIDNISLGPGNENNPSGSFLFHDSASGVQSFYQLSYEQSLRREDRIMLRADFASDDTVNSPKLNSYTIRVNDPQKRESIQGFPGFDEGQDRGNL